MGPPVQNAHKVDKKYPKLILSTKIRPSSFFYATFMHQVLEILSILCQREIKKNNNKKRKHTPKKPPKNEFQ